MSRRRQRSDSYTNYEYVDMLMCYAYVEKDCVEARKRYQSLYPKRKIPEESFFAEVDRRVRETGNVRLIDDDFDDPARPIEERIRYHYRQTPTINMRTVAQILNQSLWKIWHTVYDKVTPKNLPKSQQGERLKRRQTAMFLLDADLEDAKFLTSILWTGEVKFTMTNIISTEEKMSKKLKKRKSKDNQDISINVLMGIFKDNLYGPYFLPNNLTDAVYADFLQQLIEDLPLENRRDIIYQNDGSSKYFGQSVKDYLNEKFFNTWIGKDGPIPWQTKIPELTPLEYHVWPKMTALVYDSSPIGTVDELKKRITNAAEEIRKGLTVRVVEKDLRKRVRMYLRHHGSFTDQQLMDGSSDSD